METHKNRFSMHRNLMKNICSTRFVSTNWPRRTQNPIIPQFLSHFFIDSTIYLYSTHFYLYYYLYGTVQKATSHIRTNHFYRNHHTNVFFFLSSFTNVFVCVCIFFWLFVRRRLSTALHDHKSDSKSNKVVCGVWWVFYVPLLVNEIGVLKGVQGKLEGFSVKLKGLLLRLQGFQVKLKGFSVKLKGFWLKRWFNIRIHNNQENTENQQQ